MFLRFTVRFRSTLVLAEHRGGKLSSATLNALTAAKQLGGTIDVVVAEATDNSQIATQLSKYQLNKIIRVVHPVFAQPISSNFSPLLSKLHAEFGYKNIVAGSTSFSRDLLARFAGIMQVSMLSDVVSIKGEDVFVRNLYAGNAVCQVQSLEPVKIMTIRTTAFEEALPES